MKSCYRAELEKTVADVRAAGGDFIMTVVADSHLDDALPATREHLTEVNRAVCPDCLVHLGDFLNGNLPSAISLHLLKEEMSGFRETADCPFLPVEGNHDGYCSGRQNDIVPDEFFDAAILFTDGYPGLHRPKGKPYYYMDFPARRMRVVVLCSFHYRRREDGRYVKRYGVDLPQIDWLKEEALACPPGYGIILCSHDTPFARFTDDTIEAGEGMNENGAALMDAVLDAKAQYGFDLIGWFVGHAHGDWMGVRRGISFVLIGSQTAYVPSLWDMTDGECGGSFAPRTPGTVTEDLFDCVTVDRTSRTVRLIRFGAGSDRVYRY